MVGWGEKCVYEGLTMHWVLGVLGRWDYLGLLYAYQRIGLTLEH